VSQVVFSPDGRTLASRGDDGTVRLWDTGSRTQLGTIAEHNVDWALSVAFSPDGRTLASGGADGSVRLTDVSITSWRERLCAIAGRSFTPAEWAEFLPDQPYQETCGSRP
jgi:WD40 repeat protein